MKTKSLVNKLIGTIGFVSVLGVGQCLCNLYKITDEDYKLCKEIGYNPSGFPNKNYEKSFFNPQKESDVIKDSLICLTTFFLCSYYLNKKKYDKY